MSGSAAVQVLVGPSTPTGFARRPRAGYSGRTSVTAPHPQAPPANDAVLLPFLHAANAADANERLCVLIEHDVRPLVTRIVRQKAGGSTMAGSADVEDIAATCAAAVLERLTDLRAGRDVEPIASLSAYVAVVAYNGWHRFLRERFPVRARLKNRLRYLCGHHPALALWTDAAGALVCGLAAWRRDSPRVDPVARAAAAGDPGDGVARALGPDRRAGQLTEADAAPALFRWAGGPLLLDDLVDLVGQLLGLADAPEMRHGADDDRPAATDAIADPAPSVLAVLSDRGALARLWAEVEQLPIRQRLAVLLNLRDGDGQGVIALLPFTGVASIRRIAAVLEMPAPELAALWPALPLEDAAIAERLGITRQQVVNLRKSARARLGRKTRDPVAAAHGNTAPGSSS
jgi:hypothetical protein